MHQFGTLLKFQLRYKLGFRGIKEALGASRYGKITAAGGVLLVLFVAACILIPYTFLLNILYDSFAAAGSRTGYLDTLFLVCNVITFITSAFSTYSILFSGRDREILTPLPIKKQYIFLTNYITLYASAFASALGFLLPGLLIYEMKTGFSLMTVVKALIGSIAFPALPLAAAFLLMSAVLAAASGFRHKELLATIFGVVLVGGCVFLNGNQEFLIRFVETGAGSVSKAGRIFVNAFFLREALLYRGGRAWLFVFLCIAAAAVLICLTALYGGAVYDRILQRMSASVVTRRGKGQNYKEKAPAAAFFRKEIKTILRSPVYSLNCLINIVLAPLAAILLTRKDTAAEVLAELGQYAENSKFLLVMLGLTAGLGLTALNMVPSTSISREGKCFWILQIIPVDLKTQIKGRLAAAVLFYALSGGVFIILFGILIKMNFLYMIYGFFIILAGSVPFACSGILIDLSHPKLIWDREAEAVKQNFNGMAGMLISIVFVLIYLIPFFLYLGGILSETASLAGIPVLILLMILLNVSLLYKKIKAMEG